MNTSELFQQFIEFKKSFVCRRTIEKYTPILGTLTECYGDRPAGSLSKVDVTVFIQKIQSEGKTPETLKRKLFYLKAAWDWAIECELLTKNPWKNLPRLVRDTPIDRPNPFTQEEISKIIEGFESFENYRQLTPFVKFLFGTGCRTGEAIGLRWGDLSADCKICTFRSQLARGQRKAPKTGRIRTVKLSPSTTEMLLGLRFNLASGSDLVFLWNGNPIDAMNFRSRPWSKVLAKAEISYRKPYNTRHTFISHCLERGINPVNVAAMCGNSTRVIYQHYAGSLHNPELPEVVGF